MNTESSYSRLWSVVTSESLACKDVGGDASLATDTQVGLGGRFQ
jgi:hypothetical protein